MVQFGGGGLRSMVKIAGVVSLACSSTTICAQSSASHSASSSVGDELLQTCDVSDGDKAFGIQVIDDATCADGGLGCYNDHCRYCKVLDTLKSTHLDSCEALGANFPSMAPLTISTGSCGVSSGDAAVGVGGTTDPSCLYGGIGCFSDHCRFCQTEPTSQSSQFVKCSWVEGTSNGSGFTDSDVEGAIDSPITPTNDAKAITSGSSGPEESVAFEAGSGSACNLTASDGDVAVGISITTDTSCATGGVGCIDSVCRFCRATNTTQSAHLNACAVTTKLCTTTVSEGDAAVGINIVTDATCANGGLGCIDNVCRFCRATTTPQSTAYIDCASIGGSTSSTTAPQSTPAPTTAAPVVTLAPVTPAPTAAPTPTAIAAIKQTCTQTVSDGDAAVGIKIVSDKSCATGGLGCLDQVCRFCRATTTAQSAAFVDCASIEGATITPEPTTAAPTKTPAPSTAAPTTAPPTKTPAPTTAAPTIPAVTTPAPTSAVSSGVCSITAAAGDVVAGISIVTDASCASGGLGCIDTVCRFCRLTTTTQSASYVDCATISGAGTQAPAVTTPTPTPTPSPTPTSTAVSTTPSIVFECSRTVSSGDKGVGLDIVSDIRCSEGGTGCLDDVCRFCKRFDTAQSQSYLNCSSIPSADVGSDITFVPIPVVDDSETSTRRLTFGSAADSSESLDGTDINTTSASSTDSSYESLEATSTSTCSMTVSAGDAAVGINIVTDTSCATGGTGCIDSVCRYCKTKDTTQAGHLTSCPSTTVAAAITTKVCTSTVADGDAAVGINIITDPSCANGGLGCMDSVCRLCKTKSTDQSAHLGSCSEYSTVSTTTAPPVTVAPAPSSAAPTSAPVTTTSTYSIPLDCFQTASNGDKSLGLDIVTDIRCGDGGVGCVDSICRFCKRFETTQSHSYMKCSDIPSSDNGADINFKVITAIESTQESVSAEPIVSLHESAGFTSEADDVCANVLLADGQAAGGIGVVLDTAHCPEGLASGCIGDAGCRYCMRFPTNTSEYLEYCAVVNGTSVAYDVSGTTISIEGGSNPSDDESSSRRLEEVPSAISVEEKAPNSDLFKGTTADLVIGGVACVGAIAVVVLAAFGVKRTIRRLSSPSVPTIEKVSPDNENRASVLITSNVGEPGDIRDV